LGGLISKLHDRDNNDHETPGTGISALFLGSYMFPRGHEDGLFWLVQAACRNQQKGEFPAIRPRKTGSHPPIKSKGILVQDMR
jgi:hypothetical protein